LQGGFLERNQESVVYIRSMNWLKHIFLMMALLMVAMPCTHADAHNHVESRIDQFSAVHPCACHSCDENTVCAEPLEVAQQCSVCPAVAVNPCAAHILFVLNHYGLVFPRLPPPTIDVLTGLKTVHLLI
jgi:hypothetical protein